MKIYMYICIFFFFPKIVCATLIRNRFDRADYFSIFKNTIFLYFSRQKERKEKMIQKFFLPRDSHSEKI